METYNFPDIIRGDTFKAKEFEILKNSVALDLTDYEIKIQIRLGDKRGRVFKSFIIGDGITIIDAAAGKFNWDAFLMDVTTPGKYFYDVEFTDPDKNVNTYVGGTIQVIDDVTRIEP